MNPLSEPPVIPCWQGWAPIRYWISPEMRQFEAEIKIALATFEREWVDGKPLRLHFEEIYIPQQIRCIDFRLEPLIGLLDLAFYPPPLNGEPEAGDFALNSLVPWHTPECRNLVLPAMVHGLAAHSLGLGHSYLPESVRFPRIMEGKVNLHPMDREALVTMYRS